MIFTKWNWDDALAVRYAEGEAHGEARGMKKVLALMKKGLSLSQIEKKLDVKLT